MTNKEFTQFQKDLNVLSKKLGFGSVSSYAKLWKTSINTYGQKNASMWFFTISLNTDFKIVGIDIHSTYFKPTKQTIAINKVANFDNPIDIPTALKIIENNSK